MAAAVGEAAVIITAGKNWTITSAEQELDSWPLLGPRPLHAMTPPDAARRQQPYISRAVLNPGGISVGGLDCVITRTD